MAHRRKAETKRFQGLCVLHFSVFRCFSPVVLVFRPRLCSKQTEMKHISDSYVVITLYSTMYYNSMYTVQYNVIVKLYKSSVKPETNANCSPLHSQEYDYILLIFFLFWLHLLDFIVVPCIKQHAQPRDCNKALHTQKAKPG